jgi:glycosyltransferase 2 family protein
MSPPSAPAGPETDVDATAPGPVVGAAPSWRTWAQRALIVVLLGFAVWAVVGNRAAFADALRDMQPWAAVTAVVPALAALVVNLFVWRLILADLGFRLPLKPAARIFYISQLGKYAPGSVWAILTQIELSRAYKIPKRTSVTVVALAIAVSVTTGMSLALVLLPLSGIATIRHYWWISLVVPVLLACLHPRVLGPGLNVALRLIRKPPLPATPSWAGLGRVAGLQVLVWVLLGLHVWLLLVGLGAPAARSLPLVLGGYALAYALGQLAIGLPAGAGVREAALTLALATVVPAPTALVVALLSRVLLTVLDLAMAGLQVLIRARRA